MMKNKKKFSLANAGIYIILGVASFVSLFPFYWMFVMATRTSAAYNSNPPVMTPGNLMAENFQKVLDYIPFFKAMLNTIILCSVVTVAVLLISALAGFSFAKLEYPGANALFLAILLTMAIPSTIGIIPQYLLVAKIGLLDNLFGAMIVFFLNPMGIFLMRQYISSTVPDELIEAAKIDGYGNLGIFIKIVIPMVLPAFATLGIIVFTSVWGEFMWQHTVLRSPESYTIQVALASLNDPQRVDFAMILSGVFWATVPLIIVFLCFNKLFISSIIDGAVKS